MSLNNEMVIGISASLLSAAAWALGTVLFFRIGVNISAFGMNLCRGLLGVLFLSVFVVMESAWPFDLPAFFSLAASGVLGIAIGDTFFFKTLAHLGPRLTALIGSLGPIVTALAAIMFLGEKPTAILWMGIFLTTAGVTWLLWERSSGEAVKTEHRMQGIAYGLLFVAVSAASAILAKIGVASVPALSATFVRIACGTVCLFAWGLCAGHLKQDLAPFKDVAVLKRFSLIVLLGTFGGFWLFLVSLKHIDVSLTVALNATTPLFVLPFAAWIIKEKITKRFMTGAAIAVAGVMLCSFARAQAPIKATPMTPELIERQKIRADHSKINEIISVLGFKKNMVILDIGTGSGEYAYRFAQALEGSGKIFATDINPDMVNHVRKQAIARGLSNIYPMLVKPDGVDDFYSSNKYDLIFMAHTHMYINPLEDYVRTMREYLSPTGRFVVLGNKPDMPFRPQDITDLEGLLASIAKETQQSPFYSYLSWLQSPSYQMSMDPQMAVELKSQIAGVFNLILKDSNFFSHFIDAKDANFMTDFPLTSEERGTMQWRLAYLRESKVVDEDWRVIHPKEPLHGVGLNMLFKINQTCIIQRFRPYLYNGHSPYLPGGVFRPAVMNIDTIFSKAGYKLDARHDFIPYELLSVYSPDPSVRH